MAKGLLPHAVLQLSRPRALVASFGKHPSDTLDPFLVGGTTAVSRMLASDNEQRLSHLVVEDSSLGL